MIDITPTIAAWPSAVAAIAARAGPRRISSPRGLGGGGSGIGGSLRYQRREVGRDLAWIGVHARDQPDGDDAEQRDGEERARGAHDAERRGASARGDRDQRPDHRPDRARGGDRADAAAAQDRRVEVGGGCAAERRRPLAAAEDRGADDEQRVAARPRSRGRR